MLYGTIEGVFRSIIAAGWSVASDGDVKASTGHFAIVRIPENENERFQMREAVFLDELDEAEFFDTIAAGWYFIVEDSQGRISYSNTKNNAEAFRLFDKAADIYSQCAGE
jgi:hypothetical protein